MPSRTLLQYNIPICVITGRGRSALKLLRERIGRKFWNHVCCYLYNGGARWHLTASKPEWVNVLKDADRIARKLRSNTGILRVADQIEVASLGVQVTVHLAEPNLAETAVAAVRKILRGERI